MKISPHWLRDFVDLPVDYARLADELTLAGVAVEGISGEDPYLVYVPARFPASKSRIIEPQHSIIDVAQFLAFERGLAPGFFHLKSKREGDFEGKPRLPRSRFTHQEQRFFHRDGNIYYLAKFRAQVIALGTFELHTHLSP